MNGQSFEHGTKYARALEILKGVCHLSVTVKSNLLAFQEMLQTPEDTPRSRSRGKSTSGNVDKQNCCLKLRWRVLPLLNLDYLPQGKSFLRCSSIVHSIVVDISKQ